MKLTIYIFAILMLTSSALAINQAVLPEVRVINANPEPVSLIVEGLIIHDSITQGTITAYQKLDASKTIQVQTPSLTQSLAIPVKNNQAYTIMNLYDKIWVLQDDYKNVQFGYTKIRVLNLENTTVNVSFDGMTLFDSVTYAQEPNNVMLNSGNHDVVITDDFGNLRASFANQLFYDRAIYTIFLLNGQTIIKKDYQLWQK